MGGIVISYRRDDAQGETGHLAEELRERFGRDRVFLDVATIQPGVDFRKASEMAAQKADVLLVVIGKSWLNIKDGHGQRRLDDPSDLVRIEVATALARNVPVIPVLVQDASAPSAEELPKDLEGLAWRNAVEISHARWDYDTGKLVEALGTILKPQEIPTAPTARPAASSSASPGRIAIGAIVAIVVIALLVVQPWKTSEPPGQAAAEPSQADVEPSSRVENTPPSVTQASPSPATPAPSGEKTSGEKAAEPTTSGPAVSPPTSAPAAPPAPIPAPTDSKVNVPSIREQLTLRSPAAVASVADNAKRSAVTEIAPIPARNSALVGHWRSTNIVSETPVDEHLVLNADGTAQAWTVTPTSSTRARAARGRWTSQGAMLNVTWEDRRAPQGAQPFTIFQKQLVFPNIANQRKFWDLIP